MMERVRHDESPGALADAAANQHLQLRLKELSLWLAPYAHRMDSRFRTRLRSLRFDRAQQDALIAITMGAAVVRTAQGDALVDFLEEVRYRGRRLAKLGLTPARVVSLLGEYDSLLDRAVRGQDKKQLNQLAQLRNQLRFLVVVTLNNAFYLVREAESQTFYDLFRVEVESRSLEEMLERFLLVLIRYIGAKSGRIFLLTADGGQECWTAKANHPDGKPPQSIPATAAMKRRLARPQSTVSETESRKLMLTAAPHEKAVTCWSIPLAAQNELRGVMQFAFDKPFDWLPRETELLLAAAERCWQAAEKAALMDDLARSEEQIRSLAEQLVQIEESERRRISRELHDEAGQSLLCVRLQMELLEQELPAEVEPWRQRLAAARDEVEHTILEIRRLIAALSPAVLEKLGLAAALRQLTTRFRSLHSAAVELHLPRRLEVSKKTEIIVYRIAQEIFNNIAKYSMASTVNLWVDTADGFLTVHVEDDGVGFDVEEALARRDCFGLSGLRERVALLGGTLTVRSRKRSAGDSESSTVARRKNSLNRGQIGVARPGTSIRIQLPLSNDKASATPARPAIPGPKHIPAPRRRTRAL